MGRTAEEARGAAIASVLREYLRTDQDRNATESAIIGRNFYAMMLADAGDWLLDGTGLPCEDVCASDPAMPCWHEVARALARSRRWVESG